MNLDFMPSPVPERPGLAVRDGYHYSDATLIIPPVLAACLEFFDGEHTVADVKHQLYELTGELDTGALLDHLHETLSQAGFLEDDTFAKMQAEAHQAFSDAPVRKPAHAGAAYPGSAGELHEVFQQYMSNEVGNSVTPSAKLLGIAAPHVSPFGGWESYQAAYRALGPELRDKTFVILGTSHYGAPDRFGLTRKAFETPYGSAITDQALVERLEKDAPASIAMEDYCHSFEHSIEFQVAFLQHLYGPEVKILPILCGSYARSIYKGGKPEESEEVKRFLGALGEMHAREADRLCWVLGIDMAHMGQRYGDDFSATAEQGQMREVQNRDRQRIESINAGNAEAFWDQVQENQDDLKWCGSSPLYTFLRAVPEARGKLIRYQQWNIDEQSVVSFAGMSFERA
jgi:AmmeMemoRadiSam system protein B